MRLSDSMLSLAVLLAAALVLTGCGSEMAPATVVPTATANYRSFIQDAEAAYLSGHFDVAYAAAQAAVRAAPLDPTSWEWVRRISVAMAADDYLRFLPADRYRLSPEEYLSNSVNGQSYMVIDVRELDEFNDGHIEDAVNIPMREITQNLGALPVNTSTPILVYCRSGQRSTHVMVLLHELGYTQVYELDGGYAAYTQYRETYQLPTPGPTSTPDPARDPDHDGGC